jgi:hypothetical protein
LIETPEAPRDPDAVSVQVEGDRVAAEALALELRRLARRHGLEVQDLRVTPGERTAPDSESEPA